MKVEQFEELVSAVSDCIRSLKSATAQEKIAEVIRLQTAVAALREADWPKRLTKGRRERALGVWDAANRLIDSTGKTTITVCPKILSPELHAELEHRGVGVLNAEGILKIQKLDELGILATDEEACLAARLLGLCVADDGRLLIRNLPSPTEHLEDSRKWWTNLSIKQQRGFEWLYSEPDANVSWASRIRIYCVEILGWKYQLPQPKGDSK